MKVVEVTNLEVPTTVTIQFFLLAIAVGIITFLFVRQLINSLRNSEKRSQKPLISQSTPNADESK